MCTRSENEYRCRYNPTRHWLATSSSLMWTNPIQMQLVGIPKLLWCLNHFKKPRERILRSLNRLVGFWFQLSRFNDLCEVKIVQWNFTSLNRKKTFTASVFVFDIKYDLQCETSTYEANQMSHCRVPESHWTKFKYEQCSKQEKGFIYVHLEESSSLIFPWHQKSPSLREACQRRHSTPSFLSSVKPWSAEHKSTRHPKQKIIRT